MGDGRYAALHWRRGDKCGDSGGGERCDNAYNHPALEYCTSRSENGALPWYIASDETDANILAHWKSRGCKVWTDTGLAGRVNSIEAIFIDMLFLAHARDSYDLGDSSIARSVDAERKRLGKSGVVMVG